MGAQERVTPAGVSFTFHGRNSTRARAAVVAGSVSQVAEEQLLAADDFRAGESRGRNLQIDGWNPDSTSPTLCDPGKGIESFSIFFF